MAKSLTMKDLQAALRPLLEAVEGSNSQLSEVHSMLTNLHTKMDLFEQTASAAAEEEAPKKAKKVVRRKPKKKGAADDADVDDADDDSEAAPKKAKTKTKTKTKAVKRKPKKKGEVDEPEESDEDSDDEESDASESEKKPVKQTVKKTVKKRTTKAKAVKKTRLPNIMEYFTKMYDSDADYFSTYIKADDVAQIEEDNEDAWAELGDDALHKARRAAFYHHMKDNHVKTLKAMKEAYHEELTNVQPVIATKE